MNKPPEFSAPFRQVADMETPIYAARELARALLLMVEGLGDCSGPVNWVATTILDHLDRAEQLRCEAFHAAHPRRNGRAV